LIFKTITSLFLENFNLLKLHQIRVVLRFFQTNQEKVAELSLNAPFQFHFGDHQVESEETFKHHEISRSQKMEAKFSIKKIKNRNLWIDVLPEEYEKWSENLKKFQETNNWLYTKQDIIYTFLEKIERNAQESSKKPPEKKISYLASVFETKKKEST
jgi:hypothetical protein